MKEVIHCLGIDAPWPVSGTKEILCRAQPEEIAAGLPALTAQEQSAALMRRMAKRSQTRQVQDWADAFSENQGGSMEGFVPADQDNYFCENVINLRENSESFWGEKWVPCEFRFRGFAAEVAKLKRYAKQNDIHISWDGSVSEDIREIWVLADEKTVDLIEMFPALKVTGFAEEWWEQKVYVIYSESGFAGITDMEFGGYFDRRHEGGDGRWEWEYDMMGPVNVTFEWLQTGEEEYVSYRYPFAALWNRECYVREHDGQIYVPDSGDQP